MVRAVRDGDVAGYALRDRRLALGSRRRARIAPPKPGFVHCDRSRNANVATQGNQPAPSPVTQRESWDKWPKGTSPNGHGGQKEQAQVTIKV